jgi:hypothetical protein
MTTSLVEWAPPNAYLRCIPNPGREEARRSVFERDVTSTEPNTSTSLRSTVDLGRTFS